MGRLEVNHTGKIFTTVSSIFSSVSPPFKQHTWYTTRKTSIKSVPQSVWNVLFIFLPETNYYPSNGKDILTFADLDTPHLGGVVLCDGPNEMLFIHIASFTKNDKKYDLFYTYDFIHEKLMKDIDYFIYEPFMWKVTSGPSHTLYIVSWNTAISLHFIFCMWDYMYEIYPSFWVFFHIWVYMCEKHRLYSIRFFIYEKMYV